MKKEDKELLEKYTYLDAETVIDVLTKQTILEINFLRNSITRKKYLVGDSSITSVEAAAVEKLSPAFAQVKKNLSKDRKETYLLEIATEEEKLAMYEKHLKDLEEALERFRKGEGPSKKAPEGPEKTTTPGGPEKSTTPGGPEKSTTPGGPEKSTTPGGPEKPTTPGPSKGKPAGGTGGEFPTAPIDPNEKKANKKVKEVVKPKTKLWVAIGIAITAAAAWLASVLGRNASQTNIDPNEQGQYEQSEQEQPWKKLADIEPAKTAQPFTDRQPTRPVTPYEPTESPEPSVEPDDNQDHDQGTPNHDTPVNPDQPGQPDQPEPPAPHQDGANLERGEGFYNAAEGVERNYGGGSYLYSDGGIRTGDQVDLPQNQDGTVKVNEGDVAGQNPVPAVPAAPATGDEMSYEDYINGANPEQAAVVGEAIENAIDNGDFTWDWNSVVAAEADKMHSPTP